MSIGRNTGAPGVLESAFGSLSHRDVWRERPWLPNTQAALLELFVHHCPKNMETERHIAWLGISPVPRWRQKLQEVWREFFEKRKQCVSNETPSSLGWCTGKARVQWAALLIPWRQESLSVNDRCSVSSLLHPSKQSRAHSAEGGCCL